MPVIAEPQNPMTLTPTTTTAASMEEITTTILIETPPPSPIEEDEIVFDNLAALLFELVITIYIGHLYFHHHFHEPRPDEHPTN